MSEFQKLFNQMQKQIKKDEKVFKETGCRSELLVKIDAIAEMHIKGLSCQTMQN